MIDAESSSTATVRSCPTFPSAFVWLYRIQYAYGGDDSYRTASAMISAAHAIHYAYVCACVANSRDETHEALQNCIMATDRAATLAAYGVDARMYDRFSPPSNPFLQSDDPTVARAIWRDHYLIDAACRWQRFEAGQSLDQSVFGPMWALPAPSWWPETTASRFESHAPSCALSYAVADEEFATKLKKDLWERGVDCWKWDDDMTTRGELVLQFEHAIKTHKKVVLIASEASLQSPAVKREIERALQEEDNRMRAEANHEFIGDTQVVHVVRLDDYIFRGWQGSRRADLVKNFVLDASCWKSDPGKYEKRVLDPLVADLRASAVERASDRSRVAVQHLSQ